MMIVTGDTICENQTVSQTSTSLKPPGGLGTDWRDGDSRVLIDLVQTVRHLSWSHWWLTTYNFRPSRYTPAPPPPTSDFPLPQR